MTFYASIEKTQSTSRPTPSSKNPLVTGVSPKDGPPGTRIVIRGENLGVDPKDLIGLQICGVDCLLSAEWKTPSKIIARTGPGKGIGDILVTTRIGGKGTCTVGFRAYFIQTGPLQDSAVWLDETLTVPPIPGRGVPAAPIVDKDDEDALGVSDEGHQAKFSEEELLEMFPDAAGNMSLENFSPTWYLLENHHSTAFDDLKAGLAHMKRRASRRSEGPIAFMKSNLSSTLDCQKSLAEMYERFTEDDIRGTCLNSYSVLLMQAKSCADGLFKDVLGKKDSADSTRNALAVLNRFKILFYLPLTIERNVQKGDYNVVINDYVRAKSLYADTPVVIFQRVYAEVEARVKKFQHTLFTKLLQLPNTIEQQRSILRYLSNLECDGDPAWACIINQQRWVILMYLSNLECDGDPAWACIINQQRWVILMLVDCRHDHLDADKKYQSEAALKSTQPKPPISLHRRSGPRRNPTFTSTLITNQPGLKIEPPERVLFVEELSSLMTDNFPDLWKLGHAYLSGSLLKETSDKAAKVDVAKHNEFKAMILEITQLYTNLTRAALLPSSLSTIEDSERQLYGGWGSGEKDETQASWLPASVRFVRACVTSLSKLELPQECFDLLSEVTFDLRAHCLTTLLKRAIQEVRLLHQQESWSMDSDDEFGGITQLPALFENVVMETIQHLHEVVLQVRSGEPEIFSQKPVHKEASDLCVLLLQSFSECLQTLAFKLSTDSNKGTSSGEPQDDSIPPLDRRLMMCLSNCNHTTQRVLPRLVEVLAKHGYVTADATLETISEIYDDLDTELFDAYIEEKSNPIIGAIEQNLYRGDFEWKTCPRPTGVRNYMKEVIMGMIDIHAEVIEAVVEEISRLVECSADFNTSGSIQARLDLMALQDTVTLYQTETVITTFKEALESLPEIGTDDKKHLDELLNKFRSQMNFHIMCFYSDSNTKTPITPVSPVTPVR